MIMKNIVRICMVIFTCLLFTGCYDRDVVGSKGTHYILPKVENLDYSVQGNTVKLTWQIPDNIPDEFLRPLEVSIQKVENDIYRDVITIGNEGTFAEGIAIDANKRYRFVVKLVGNLTDEVVETGISSRIYSEGQVIDQFIADYVFATDKESINIQAIPDDPNAQVEIKGNTKLKDGNNDIEIKVTAEDKKTSKSYFLHITKGNKDLANANLKSLEVKGYGLNPAFNSKDVEYLITYEGSINNLNIEAIPENEKATVQVLNNSDFSSMYHVVTIKVTAENGITNKEYKVIAKKIKDGNSEDEEENEGGLESNTEKTEEVSNEIDENDESKDEILDEENVNLNKENEKEQNNYNSTFIVIGIVVGVLIIAFIIYMIRKKKK